MARASGPASLGLVLVATFHATTLALWAGHWFSHLPWSPFRTFHLRGHHTLYPDSRHTRSARFRYGSGRASSIPALLPWLVIEATLASVLVAGWRLPITLGEIVILVVLLNAVHTQFHLLAPWLEERRWFRTAPPPLAAELHAGDVDPVPATERADAADDAGDVEIGEDEHPALRQGLDRKAIDPHEARLALEEDRPRDRRGPPVGHQLGRHQARVVFGLRRGGLRDLEPARLRDREGVHVGDPLGEDRAKEATDERERERRRRLGLVRRGAEVRRDDHLLEPEQRVVGGWRLLLEDVERRARHAPAADRVGERPLVHDAAPGAVDDPDSGLDAGERVLAEQMAGVPRQGHVNRDEVGAREEIVELDGFDALTLCGLARQIGIVGDDVHTKAERPPRDLGPDAPEPQHAQHFTEELDALQPALLPAAALERGVGRRDTSCERQEEGQRVLGNRRGVATRRVHHDHAALGRGVHVDRVHARARATDDLEPGARRQHGAGDPGGAADDQPLVLTDARDERRLRERLRNVDLEPLFAEEVDADGLQAVGDEDPLHDFSAKIFCAARTLAPKSTGWPRSASTCSRADSAMITSNSAAYPMWPSRKTLPFISP